MAFYLKPEMSQQQVRQVPLTMAYGLITVQFLAGSLWWCRLNRVNNFLVVRSSRFKL